ncbi:hypothetical protein [Tumebacillus lipolyticus]|uniref:Peptidase M23 n=1 Tax=Tumebacillus lipolyticus TaxID=1280370 RepID=A0ABW4ZTQ2_9BACL
MLKRMRKTALTLFLLTALLPSSAAATNSLDTTDAAQKVTAELTEYRGQLRMIKQKEQTIRILKHQINDQSYELRQLLRKANDRKLTAGLEQQFATFDRKRSEANLLQEQGDRLKKSIHAARINRDLKRLRLLTAELDQLKMKQLERLREANQEVEELLAQVQERANRRK